MKRFVRFAAIVITLCAVSAVSMGEVRPLRIQDHRNSVGTPRRSSPGQEKKILVIMAEYQDQSFFYGKEYFEKMLTQQSYSHEGASGSAKEYLDTQFGADFSIDVAGPVKVSELRHWYGVNNSLGYDTHPATFVAEACTLADSLVNFADYDCDADGYVDNLFVFYAGEDESQQIIQDEVRQNSDYMWSHSSTLSGGDYGQTLELDGVKVDRYACSSEIYLRYTTSTTAKSYMAPVGTFLHELMHTFGLADMYDTDYALSGGTAAGLWRTTCLMDAGNYNNNGNTPPNLNSLEKERLGLIKYEELSEGKKFIYPVGDSAAVAYRISNSADSSDYYVLECRYASQTGWDRYIGGNGLLLYHVDVSKDRSTVSDTYGQTSPFNRWNKYNEVNARPDHQCADLVEADGRSDTDPSSSSFADITSIFFPQTSSRAFGGSSAIPLSFWDGTQSSMYIYNITDCGEGTISFYVRDSSSPVPPVPDTPPEEMDMLYIIAQSDSTNTILTVSNQVGASVEWTFNGSTIANPLDFRPSESGTVKAAITWPDGSQDVLYKKIVR